MRSRPVLEGLSHTGCIHVISSGKSEDILTVYLSKSSLLLGMHGTGKCICKVQYLSNGSSKETEHWNFPPAKEKSHKKIRKLAQQTNTNHSHGEKVICHT